MTNTYALHAQTCYLNYLVVWYPSINICMFNILWTLQVLVLKKRLKKKKKIASEWETSQTNYLGIGMFNKKGIFSSKIWAVASRILVLKWVLLLHGLSWSQYGHSEGICYTRTICCTSCFFEIWALLIFSPQAVIAKPISQNNLNS